jgi:hypothetical protein
MYDSRKSSLLIEEFKPEHFDRLEAQGTDTKWMWPASAMKLAKDAPGFAVIARASNRVVCCCGLVVPWPDRAIVWIALDHRAREHVIALHRWVSGVLSRVPMRRMEYVLAADDAESSFRWARMLGFQREGHMPYYYPDGRDGYTYVRISKAEASTAGRDSQQRVNKMKTLKGGAVPSIR